MKFPKNSEDFIFGFNFIKSKSLNGILLFYKSHFKIEFLLFRKNYGNCR